MRPNLNSPYFVLLSIVADAAAVMGLIVQSMDACTIYFREQRVPTGMELVKLVMWALFALGSAILSVCVFKSLGKSSLARKYKKDIEPRKKKEIVLEWLKFQTKSGEGCSLFVVRILTYSAIALLALNLAMHGTMGILTPVGRRIYGAYCLTPQAATSVAMRMETALARTRVVTPRPLATPIVTQMPSPSPTAVQIVTPSATPTYSLTATVSSPTPTRTATPTSSLTPSYTPTVSPTLSNTPQTIVVIRGLDAEARACTTVRFYDGDDTEIYMESLSEYQKDEIELLVETDIRWIAIEGSSDGSCPWSRYTAVGDTTGQPTFSSKHLDLAVGMTNTVQYVLIDTSQPGSPADNETPVPRTTPDEPYPF